LFALSLRKAQRFISFRRVRVWHLENPGEIVNGNGHVNGRLPCAARIEHGFRFGFTIRITGCNLFGQPTTTTPRSSSVYFQQLNLSKDFQGGRKHGGKIA